MRFTPIILATALSSCMAVKTFDDATQNVNEGFALGARLRDRCVATNDLGHCKEWIEYKRAEEAAPPHGL